MGKGTMNIRSGKKIWSIQYIVLNTSQSKIVLSMTFSSGLPCLILHSPSDGLSVPFVSSYCQEAVSDTTPRDCLS